MVKEFKGDLLDTQAEYICHQVNCMGVMGSGVAKAIRDQWPQVYEAYKAETEYKLGTIQVVPVRYIENEVPTPEDSWNFLYRQYVINMFSQYKYGYDGQRYTNYEAFYRCLEEISKEVPKHSTIAFPKYIGCGRGGADWDIIYMMIDKVLGKDWMVYIYEK